jgi:oxygen-independent coproporphyrinogen-3 oxidase
VCAALPDGDPAPADGALPASAVAGLGRHGFGIYLHVPFCAARCGYCDFTTYTPAESGGGTQYRDAYVGRVLAELELARRVLGADTPPVDTVFVGGGTPTLLPPTDLARLLEAIGTTFGLREGAEVTVEANPETVDPATLRALCRAGFTRISLGMQSAVPHVLAVLDRRHRPGRPEQAVADALAAGFEHVSLDLIYGTPGETAADWAASLAAATATAVDHVSAYALVVEPGTALARTVRAGLLPGPDDDVLADRYEQADAALAAAGLHWYEVSNWARDKAARCRHNLLYWRGGDWWGLGPGAHSHVNGVRWWNVKHPRAYGERLNARESPAAAREVLGEDSRRLEDVLLGVRLVDGLPLDRLDGSGRAAAVRAAADGLLDPAARAAGRAVLTRRGRLLADAVVRDLLG